MSRDAGDEAKRIAPPCAISELLTALDEASTAAALEHRRQGRSAKLHDFLMFPLHALWALVRQRPVRLDLLGLTFAVLRAYGGFTVWAKVWEAEHCRAPEADSPSHPPCV